MVFLSGNDILRVLFIADKILKFFPFVFPAVIRQSIIAAPLHMIVGFHGCFVVIGSLFRNL